MEGGMQDSDDVFEITVELGVTPGSASEPTAFSLGSRRVEVREIQDRWHGADHSYFRLTDADDALYILRHNTLSGRWALTLFKGRPDASPGLDRRSLT